MPSMYGEFLDWISHIKLGSASVSRLFQSVQPVKSVPLWSARPSIMSVRSVRMIAPHHEAEPVTSPLYTNQWVHYGQTVRPCREGHHELQVVQSGRGNTGTL